jgi:hypothetical protein
MLFDNFSSIDNETGSNVVSFIIPSLAAPRRPPSAIISRGASY